MERRTGFAVAGAVAMILVAGAIAAGANLGLLRSSRDSSKVGHLTPAQAAVSTTDQAPQIVTVEVQDPAHTATAKIVDPGSSGSPQDVQVETIQVPASRTSATASSGGETEHETSPSTSGATSDD